MKLIRNLDELSSELQHRAVTVGNFDGVHQGHARIMRRVCHLAQDIGGPAVAFTFDPHPVRLLRPDEAPPPLTWTRRKAELLGQIGIDALIAFPTTAELLSLSPEEFFEQIVINRLKAKAMVEGPNFCFGKDRTGGVSRLRELCGSHAIQLEIVEPLAIDGEIVSSSRIRKIIAAGDVDAACRLLTQPYRLRGMVTHGSQRGMQIGFPTANLEAIDTLIPGLGVYAGRAHLRGESYRAAIHVGPSPTFEQTVPRVEVHLLGFDKTVYGEPLEVDFLRRLRDIQSFPSADDLVAQLQKDIAAAAEQSIP